MAEKSARAVFFLALAMQTCVSSCSSHRLYKGPGLPAEEVACLSLSGPLAITEIDGMAPPYSPFDVRRRFELLPGDHSLEVSFTPGGYDWSYSEKIRLTFDAERGHEYRLEHEIRDLFGGAYYNRGTWRAWVRDEATGEVVSKQRKGAEKRRREEPVKE